MIYNYEISFIICLLLFVLILFIKKEKIIWILFFCLSLLPFFALILGAIYSIFNGSGLVGDTGGIDSGLFVVVVYITYRWYIFVPSLILLMISIYKLFIVKKN